MKDALEFYQSQLKIDRNELDKELSEFPSAFYTVCDYLVDAERRAKRLEQRLNREKASISSALREVAEEEGIRNYTETRIKQETSMHPKVQTLTTKLAQAEKVAKRWDTLKEAMVQKSFSLKGLVSLAMHENFQTSTATVDGNTVSRKRRKR